MHVTQALEHTTPIRTTYGHVTDLLHTVPQYIWSSRKLHRFKRREYSSRGFFQTCGTDLGELYTRISFTKFLKKIYFTELY